VGNNLEAISLCTCHNSAGERRRNSPSLRFPRSITVESQSRRKLSSSTSLKLFLKDGEEIMAATDLPRSTVIEGVSWRSNEKLLLFPKSFTGEIATTKTKNPKLTYVPRNSRPFTMRVSSVYGTEEGLKNTGMKVNPTWKWNMKDKSGALSIEYKKHCRRHNRHG